MDAEPAPRVVADRDYPSLEDLWAPHLGELEASRSGPNQAAVIPLWSFGAPGFEDRRDEPELAKSYWVKNVHSPSLTAFLPSKASATGAAVIICPGGGHSELVFGVEGTQPAEWFQANGIAAFVLKYRLSRERGSPYNVLPHVKQDGQRAMRLVRSLPKELGIVPDRIGMLGFSAGGDVVSMVAHEPGLGVATAQDPVDRLAAQPNFIVLAYAGSKGTPKRLSHPSPPAFLLAAKDDWAAHRSVSKVAARYEKAGLPYRLLSFPEGGHGFSIGQKSDVPEIKAWPNVFTTWLAAQF